MPFTARNARLAGAAPPVVDDVTFERLVHARSEPQNWLTYYGAYDGQRYSALDQINAGNVNQLQVAWSFQNGIMEPIANQGNYSFEATPIVVDGVMFLSGPDGFVWALDATDGRMLWQYRRAVPFDVPLCCGNVNRGVAVADGKVFVVSANGYLTALDATTGEAVWSEVFVDVRAGESATLAPLVVKNMVLVGSSGAEYGVRGHIDAFDVDTGQRLWRRYNVPKPGEPGSDSWQGDAWARGGGTAWITGSYDPELDLVYWGTGNPGPDFNGSVRPGKNLYTDSIIAFDPDDGSLAWYYQTTPHDVWDYDGVNENILFDRGGRKLLAHFDKNGYLFILDRTDGSLVHVTPFTRTTWGSIDPQTGKVTVKRTPTPAGTKVCPGPAGGKEWPHAAYDRETQLLYTPIVNQCAIYKTGKTEFNLSLSYWGGTAAAIPDKQSGAVAAFDPMTGNKVWAVQTEHPVVASVLTTAGDLVFVGKANGQFIALNARTGQQLWQFQTGSGIHASAITYSVEGRQYIAIASGWGGWIKGFAPELLGAPRGNTLFVFALPGDAALMPAPESQR
ncbi:MAG TPA: PQQ-dependent dehydrogenase, methanol/ethanol family [Gammaproteobacteria bacterium]|nr:PQQ-dependent dehydrogenase, methanol/ethanol family [Gammaproteobacteria bacterium]